MTAPANTIDLAPQALPPVDSVAAFLRDQAETLAAGLLDDSPGERQHAIGAHRRAAPIWTALLADEAAEDPLVGTALEDLAAVHRRLVAGLAQADDGWSDPAAAACIRQSQAEQLLAWTDAVLAAID